MSRKKTKKRRRSNEASEATMEARTETNRSDVSAVDEGWDIGDDIPLPPLKLKKKPAPVEVAPAPPVEPEPEQIVHVESSAVAAMAATTGAADDIQAENERMMQAVKQLNETDDRNQVFDILLDHLAHVYERVGFFAVKKNMVCSWKGRNLPESTAEVASESSIFGPVVADQVPFRGHVDDERSIAFITDALGAPPDEVIAMPVAIGARVIGVLCGDGRHGTVFEQQLAMVTRTAGAALERIITSKKK